jgi:mRNA interferase RelE/StbE
VGHREKKKAKAQGKPASPAPPPATRVYQVEIYPSALRALAQLPQPSQDALKDKLKKLVNDPRPYGSEELEGKKGYYRIRQGNYRAIYVVDDRIVRVVVVKIGDRKEIYRNLKALQ